MKKILFVVNVDWFFLSHRLPIAIGALANGYEVHVACAVTNKYDELRSHGFTVHPLPVKRGRSGFSGEASAFFHVFNVIRVVKPDILHLVTIKPVIYGGIAARLLRVPSVVAAVSGLGFVFLAKGLKAAIVRSIVSRLYRLALGRGNLKVICQNPDDCETMIRVAGVAPDKIVLIPGSGVDLGVFMPKPETHGVPVIVLAARLLRDKGVQEFVAAATSLKDEGAAARFWLVGDLDRDNPSSVTEAELSTWVSGGKVEHLGYRKDMADVFAQASVVVLPSYREGLPKVLLEAAACGRAVVTTDVPGCRDAIVPEVTGLLIPARDSLSLAEAIRCLLNDPDRCERMGRAGRRLAEERFSVDRVVATHLDVYRSLEEDS